MIVVAIWAFAEALLWFIVADVPISAIGLFGDIRRAVGAALVAAIAAAVGGQAMLIWAQGTPDASRAALDLVPGIDGHMIAAAANAWQADRFAAMLHGSFTGTPYKLYAHAAGIDRAAPIAFFVMSAAARLPRFLLVAVISAKLGPVLRLSMARRQAAAAFVGFWALFYVIYFMAIAQS